MLAVLVVGVRLRTVVGCCCDGKAAEPAGGVG